MDGSGNRSCKSKRLRRLLRCARGNSVTVFCMPPAAPIQWLRQLKGSNISKLHIVCRFSSQEMLRLLASGLSCRVLDPGPASVPSAAASCIPGAPCHRKCCWTSVPSITSACCVTSAQPRTVPKATAAHRVAAIGRWRWIRRCGGLWQGRRGRRHDLLQRLRPSILLVALEDSCNSRVWGRWSEVVGSDA